MPHFKCVACRTRLYSAAGPADLVGDLCPGCGSLLEAVGEPAEVVGFRSIRSRDGAVDGGAQATHQRIAERFGDFIAGRGGRFSPRRGLTPGAGSMMTAVSAPRASHCPDRRRARERRQSAAGAALPLPV
jgi:hypothetical protein